LRSIKYDHVLSHLLEQPRVLSAFTATCYPSDSIASLLLGICSIETLTLTKLKDSIYYPNHKRYKMESICNVVNDFDLESVADIGESYDGAVYRVCNAILKKIEEIHGLKLAEDSNVGQGRRKKQKTF
jgi:hypothetical protein